MGQRIKSLSNPFASMAHARVYMMELKQALFKELAGASIDRKKIQDLKAKLKEKKDLQSELMIDNMLAYASSSSSS